VLGIVLATFFSDVGHEMVTAVLPLYLADLALGAAAIGVMEGVSDLLLSLSKLAGGWLGHRTEKKRAWGTGGYVTTAFATCSIALARGFAALATLRAIAWIGRGVRGPLRDFLLSDEVEESHYGRAYGVERAADMLGAVTGPLLAATLVYLGVSFRWVIAVSVVPSLLAALSFFGMTRDRPSPPTAPDDEAVPSGHRLPRPFWAFTGAVGLFGMGDFSRTFLVFLAARALGEGEASTAGTVSLAVLLYALHNAVSAVAAYPAGHLGDAYGKGRVLTVGYALGVVTHLVLAFGARDPGWLTLAVILSGIYVAVEEALEKATAVALLPRPQRTLGLGYLATANAVGDMLSSLFVGWMLAEGRGVVAFGVPAVFALAGTLWMAKLAGGADGGRLGA